MSKHIYDVSEILLELLNGGDINKFIFHHRITENAILYFSKDIKWNNVISTQKLSNNFIEQHLINIILNDENIIYNFILLL